MKVNPTVLVVRTIRRYIIVAAFFLAAVIGPGTGASAQSADEWMAGGDTLIDGGNYTGAVTCYTRAVEADPENPEAFKKRGAAYGRLERYEEAIADFSRAIELAPEDAAAYYGRGINYYAQGRYDLALPDFEAACGLGNELACKIYEILQNR